MKKILTVVPAPALLSAVPVHAAPFAGPRAELRAGWDRTEFRHNFLVEDDVRSANAGDSRIGYGGELGFDAGVGGPLRLGLYAGIGGGKASACGSLAGEDELCVRSGRTLSFGARAGVAAGQSAFFYAKGGYSVRRLAAEYEASDELEAESDADRVHRVRGSRGGHEVGLGFEFAIGGGAYSKAEYLFSEQRRLRVADERLSFETRQHRHQIVAGIGFRF
ncbi:MAG: outer membrane protein [Allosphingosinicella sp.]|uniref:outer membrane protein n=1 Tax=Allosphingosinicella sp. TaxID=2823234 RepID=UPI00394A377B